MLTQTKSVDKPVKAQAAPSRDHGDVHQTPGPSHWIGISGVQQFAGNLAIQRLFNTGFIQAKLSISQPHDPYEEEADQVADEVMRMRDGAFSGQHSAIGKGSGGIQMKPGGTFAQCPACGEKEIVRPQPLEISRLVERQVQEDEPFQTTRDENGSSSLTSSAEPSIAAVPGNGKPLSESERAFFEPRFGWDFSKVRIHTDNKAHVLSKSVNALAYTMGSDVVFGDGQYRPGTEGGRKLLAHELAHTIQQTGAGAPEIRRKIGDGHDLTAARFAGDLVLEAVYDNERLLQKGDKGTAVRKLQQALLDAGFSLPRFSVDGDFGEETTAAVYDLQRASGLAGGMGKGFDGIVGPTTMGWLDQRFSAGPTPPGTTFGATPGCTTIKTVNVDIVFLDGSTRNGLQDLDKASSIFNQCCVRFVLAGGGSESPEGTRALLGGDNVLHINPKVGNPTAEEIGMFNGAAADFNLSGRIRIFYVGSITPSSTPFGHTGAYSVPPVAATGFGAAVMNMVVITNTASERGLAHELGHILLNEGNSAHQDMDPEYLMSPAGPTPGERITPTQCGTILANA